MTTLITGDGSGVVSGGSSGFTINITPITGGTTTRLLYDAAGKVGETAGVTYNPGTVGTLTFSGQGYPGHTLISSTAAANQKVWNIFNGPDNGGAFFIQSVHDDFTTIDSEFRFNRNGTLRSFGANSGLLLGPTEAGADDVGLTRIGVGVLGVGNGTAGNSSGALTASGGLFVKQASGNDGVISLFTNGVGIEAASTPIQAWYSAERSAYVRSDGLFSWSNETTLAAGARDTGLSRLSAGVVGVGNGTAGSVAGTIKATIQTAANATTGLVAGALAATTNASLVLTDGSGQVYRVPCII